MAAGATPPLPPTPLARVLVVNDVRDITEFIGQHLTAHGYEVYLAYDGYDALRKARYFRPDIIVLNIIMPHLDGLTAMPLLRAIPGLNAKIIINSAAIATRGPEIAAGADGILPIPFAPQELRAEVARLVPC